MASLEAEMRAEVQDGWISPQAGFALTKESVRGAAVGILTGAGVGIVAGVVAALVFGTFWPFWVRLVTFGAIGVFGGATAGFILGAAESEKGSQQRMAAERGVTTRVDGYWPELASAWFGAEPLRLDLVDPDGTPTGRVLTTEEGPSRSRTQQALRTAWREPDRDPLDQHDQVGRRQR